MAACIPVALKRCESYQEPVLESAIFDILENTGISKGTPFFPALVPGMNILVKPNLLMSRHLACTSPGVVAAVCKWLLDHGVRITVADSPGFGRAASVARYMGLDDCLHNLGLTVTPLGLPVKISLKTEYGIVRIPVSRTALECDAILSLPRVKAHSQMLVTLAVKNCFGCVCGIAKAFVHGRHGQSTQTFASVIAALWKTLPPVAGVADGIYAMHVTGPAEGKPFPLRILGASSYAPALDEALCVVLGLRHDETPVGNALSRLHTGKIPEISYPLSAPENFDASGFMLPQKLKPASFNPFRLAVSCIRRFLAIRRH